MATKAKKTIGILQQHRKKTKKTAAEEKKALEVGDITEEIINNTTQITILKAMAKKLRVPDLVSYKIPQINKLKAQMIIYLKKLQEEGQGGGEEIVEAVREEDNNLNKQYKAIEKLITAYATNPGKTTGVYGKAGDEFAAVWNKLNKPQKSIFVQDYVQLNVGDKKVNPVKYITEWYTSTIEETKDTVGSVTVLYLRSFIKDTVQPTQANSQTLQELSTHTLMNAEFLTRFRSLDPTLQLQFAGGYIRTGGLRHPVDALNLFIEDIQKRGQKKTLDEVIKDVKDAEANRPRVKKLLIGGLQPRKYIIAPEEEKDIGKNRFDKCIIAMAQLNMALKKDETLPLAWVGPTIEIEEKPTEYHLPTKEFFLSLCQYSSYVKSPTESIIIILTDKKISIPIQKYESGKLSNYSPSDLSKDLQTAQTGNIFVKLSPTWLLSSPLYQVDEIYINQAAILLRKWTDVKYDKIIADLQRVSRPDTLLEYYTQFFLLFAPYIPNTAKYIPPIVDQMKNGYYTVEGYANTPLARLLPGVNYLKMIPVLQEYIESVIAPYLIRATTKLYLTLPPFEIKPEWIVKINCPEAEEWHQRDLVIYENRCYPIPLLYTQFVNDNYIDPKTNSPFEQWFIDGFIKDNSKFQSERFQKKNGTYVYPDKLFYDKAHPVVIKVEKKEKYSPDDLSGQFDKYFEVKEIIVDPIALITNLATFNISEQCKQCKQVIGDRAAKSLINRSDGTIIQISFCDYKCMLAHDFQPMATIEELEELNE